MEEYDLTVIWLCSFCEEEDENENDDDDDMELNQVKNVQATLRYCLIPFWLKIEKKTGLVIGHDGQASEVLADGDIPVTKITQDEDIELNTILKNIPLGSSLSFN